MFENKSPDTPEFFESKEDASVLTPADLKARDRAIFPGDFGTLQPDRLPPNGLSLEARRKCENPI